MCIICNAEKYGDAAYCAHLSTGKSMKETADLFLKCSQECKGTIHEKKYKAIAYKMKRMAKDWNRLEEERES